jgi:hypothetical protein
MKSPRGALGRDRAASRGVLKDMGITRIKSIKVLVLMVIFAACSHAGKTTDAMPTTSSDAVLEITDLKFFEGDKLGAHLHADGRLAVLATHGGTSQPTTESWQDVAMFHADGRITSIKRHADPASVSAHVNADGSIVGPRGEVAPFKLDGATLVADGKHLTINGEGTFVIDGKQGDKALRVEGVRDAMTQRTALIIIGILMDFGELHTKVIGGSVHTTDVPSIND